MKHPVHAAFSLIELLAVLAIMGLLVGLAAPAVTRMMAGTELTRAGEKMLAVLSLARHTAMAKNRAVEVRFYQYGDPSIPGESSGSPNSGKFRAVQLFEIDDLGKATPINRSESMPSTVIMDSSAALSNLLNASSQGKTWTVEDPQTKIPSVGTSYNCRAFRMLPDGSTNLAASGLWYITLHNRSAGDGLADPPANYVTVQVDPANGALKTWRP